MEERGKEAAEEKEKQGPETTLGAAEEADDVSKVHNVAELSLSRMPKLKPKHKPMPMPMPKSNLNPDSNSIVLISSSSPANREKIKKQEGECGFQI